MSGAMRPRGDMLGRGLAFPFRVGRHGGLVMAEGEEDVAQAIRIILSTVPGERSIRPGFGCDIHSFVFEGLDAATFGHIEKAIRRALERWEPRIIVEAIEFSTPQGDDGTLLIHITYTLRTTNSKRNLIYPFYVVPAEA
jgi:phage baseplate assembly protein W